MNYYCRYCGIRTSSIASLKAATCSRHPNGVNKGQHAPYEGDEKARYQCRFCGFDAATISSLTSTSCPRHPLGAHLGFHSPAT